MQAVLAVKASSALFAGVIAVLGAGALGLGALAAGRLRRRRLTVPPALRPGPSDEALERRILDRYLAIGAIFTVFMAIFLPALLAAESHRLEQKTDIFEAKSIDRGRVLFGRKGPAAFNCGRCHGDAGEGGIQTYVSYGKEHTFAEPPLRYIVERYRAAGRNDQDIRQLVYDAVERGRPGTPMPTWGLAFGGPLNAEQLEDLVNFLLAPKSGGGLQVDPPKATSANGAALFAQNCAVCHGERAEGGVGPNLTIELQRNTRQQIFDIIFGGRLNTNRPSMPAWAYLGDDAVEALVAFIQSIQGSA